MKWTWIVKWAFPPTIDFSILMVMMSFRSSSVKKGSKHRCSCSLPSLKFNKSTHLPHITFLSGMGHCKHIIFLGGNGPFRAHHIPRYHGPFHIIHSNAHECYISSTHILKGIKEGKNKSGPGPHKTHSFIHAFIHSFIHSFLGFFKRSFLVFLKGVSLGFLVIVVFLIGFFLKIKNKGLFFFLFFFFWLFLNPLLDNNWWCNATPPLFWEYPLTLPTPLPQ